MIQRHHRQEVVLALMTFLWASTFIVTKDILRAVPPLAYLSLRYLVAAVILLALAPRALRWSRRLWWDGLVIGGSTAAGLLVQVLGQVYTTASKSAFVTALCTALTPLMALALHHERPRRMQTAGIVVATIGLYFLTYPVGCTTWNTGDLLTLVSAFIYAFTIVEMAHRSRHHRALDLAAAQVTVATVLFVVLLGLARLTLWLLPPEQWPSILTLEHRTFAWSGKLVVELAYMAVFCTVLTIIGQTWALARMSATHAAVIFSLEPVLATALAVAVEGSAEWPGMRGIAGACCILAAILIAELKLVGREERRHHQLPGTDGRGQIGLARRGER